MHSLAIHEMRSEATLQFKFDEVPARLLSPEERARFFVEHSEIRYGFYHVRI